MLHFLTTFALTFKPSTIHCRHGTVGTMVVLAFIVANVYAGNAAAQNFPELDFFSENIRHVQDNDYVVGCGETLFYKGDIDVRSGSSLPAPIFISDLDRWAYVNMNGIDIELSLESSATRDGVETKLYRHNNSMLQVSTILRRTGGGEAWDLEGDLLLAEPTDGTLEVTVKLEVEGVGGC